MQLCRARLKKLNTNDGLLPLRTDENLQLGQVFLIDLDSKQTVVLEHNATQTVHEKIIVQDAENGGWLPWECLEIFV